MGDLQTLVVFSVATDEVAGTWEDKSELVAETSANDLALGGTVIDGNAAGAGVAPLDANSSAICSCSEERALFIDSN